MFQRLIYVLVITLVLYLVAILLSLPLSHIVEVIYVLLAALYVLFGDRMNRV